MDLPETSRLYSAAIAAAKFADQRLEARTRTDYTGSLRRVAAFCCAEGYPDPLKQRFIQLPAVIAAYINQLATSNKSQWPAEKLRPRSVGITRSQRCLQVVTHTTAG
ncbi:hypothetical protein PC129_g13297 [Phytophthora cactorum]|uniref:Uncharacterized protein n=1 Tax=Phytophthora cactorum TaxID=29920 RepID=A0A8T1KB51_9STRA|nr:hypothetical protein PC112_g15046 [Phytophthora cactorum]KAG2835037.1 hypothetical protein PC111_g5574 [Phytophthora cactorum]KAG2852989.1 hypothetical protein PC113_g14558 [Phytophthora cactorum]KAG2895366.1 hypothetical protein PC114_g15507 [Phytophthora cactorum]KAG2908750.1 hypothetical protein PC115_g13506 [Phytophthora cactorum]